jgi:hypothetical protein
VRERFNISSRDLHHIIDLQINLVERDFQVLDILLGNKTLAYKQTVHALFKNPRFESSPARVAEAMGTNVLDVLYILSEDVELSYERYVELNASFKKGVY